MCLKMCSVVDFESLPLEFNSEKMGNFTHKVNQCEFLELLWESGFYFIVFREIDEVVHIDP